MANEIYGQLNQRDDSTGYTGVPTTTTDTFVDNDAKTIRVFAKVNTELLEADMATLNTKVAGVEAKIASMTGTKNQVDTAENGHLNLSVSQTEGKITSIAGFITANAYDTYGAATNVKNELRDDVADEYNTLNKIKTKIEGEATRASTAEATLGTNITAETTRATTAEETLTANLSAVDTKVDTEISNRTTITNGLTFDVDTLKAKVGNATDPGSATGSLYARITLELADRQAADTTEKNDRLAADTALSGRIANFEAGGTYDIPGMKLLVEANKASITNLRTDLNAEVQRSSLADATMAEDISDLTADLASEVSTRTAVTNNLTTEVNNLKTSIGSPLDTPAADGSVYARIAKEKEDRQAADSTEVTARTNADNALGVRITSAEGQVTILSGKVGTVETTVNALNTRVSNAESNITDLQGRMGTTETEMASLENRTTTAENNITTLTSDVSIAKDNITVLQGNVNTINSRLTTDEANITANATSIYTLNNTVAPIKTKVDNLANVATSGKYIDLIDYPTKTSSFINDGENGSTRYATQTWVENKGYVLPSALIDKQDKLYPGEGIVINSNNIIYANQTMGQTFTTTVTVGGIAQGTLIKRTDKIVDILKQLLGPGAPAEENYIYRGLVNPIPTTTTDLEEIAIDKPTLLSSGYTWKINGPVSNKFMVLAVPKSLGIEVSSIATPYGPFETFVTVDLGDVYLYSDDIENPLYLDEGETVTYIFSFKESE